jgi:N-sulfoglucosamine sulfohydrolase
MREATESWQQTLGDTGMVPEAVLMEAMKPGGETPATLSPTIARVGGMISLACETEGASIVYQTQQGETWSDWVLYTKSFTPPASAGRIRATACRLGYRDSKAMEQPIR